jgi:protein-L-isoaspartate(D-aspartate) O-methyltransferase
LAVGCLPAEANVPVPYDWNAAPPMDDKLSFVEWMVRNRGEEAGFLGQRWDRFRQAVVSRDLWDQRDMRAFLLTPREHFVTNPNLSRAPMDRILSASATERRSAIRTSSRA